MAELAVPVLDGSGQPRAALCARIDPAAFSGDGLEHEVAAQLVRAARVAGRAMADA
jgi:DNA-binding IclR family transcriptional regulator